MSDSYFRRPDPAPKSKRVLIVTTHQKFPSVFSIANGMSILTDLTGAGYPFDVVTFQRFITMRFDASDNHDIIYLNGHTSPVDSHLIGSKCLDAMQAGRKIFINGHLPYTHYDKEGKLMGRENYCEDLFNLKVRSSLEYGKIAVPKALQKDSAITKTLAWPKRVGSFWFETPPEICITLGKRVVGFLTDKGGAIDGSSDFFFNLLDYGKVTGYLRYGDPKIIGFANDRITGRPIFALEVHCDISSDIGMIDSLEALANKVEIPLVNMLVLDRCTPKSDQRWNEASQNPLILIGSHSRTHPKFWPEVSDFSHETIYALEEQRQRIPSTINYFNFSGRMDPTVEQLEMLHASGILCGGQGHTARMVGRPFGVPWQYYQKRPLMRFLWRILNRLAPPHEIQLMPICKEWFALLAESDRVPFLLSQTIWSDYKALRNNQSYLELVKKAFFQNLKYGIYNFGGIHDYSLDVDRQKFQTRGVHLKDQITEALFFLKAENVIFISADDLIARLNDFVDGWIDYQKLPDSSLKVTVHRQRALANQVKLEGCGSKIPVASGKCVAGQTLVGKMLYVDLVPEAQSTFKVTFKEQV